jgi:hypothetical protein
MWSKDHMASHVINKSVGTRVTYGLVQDTNDGDVFLTVNGERALRFRTNGKFSRISGLRTEALAKLDDGRWAIPA